MRRLAAGLVAVAVLASGCTKDKKQDAAKPSSTSTSTSTTAAADKGADCAWTEPAGGGEATWVADGQLRAAEPGRTWHCLAAGVSGRSVQWSGDGAKALVDGRLLSAQGVDRQFTQAGLRLSRPLGRSVIAVGDRVLKFEAGSTGTKDITFVDHPTEVIYHPAGRSIVAAGTDNSGKPVLKIADNQGQGARDLVTAETAERISTLAFTASNALLFVADHGDHQHLHRLELATAKLTTVAEVRKPNGLAHVTTSPFAGGGVAWNETGPCKLVMVQDAKFVAVADPGVAAGTPVGWLGDRSLVVKADSCGASAVGDLYAVGADGVSKLIVEDAGTAAVRAVLPDPTPPPADVPDDAPA
jgi:hypothetical protein